MLGADRIQKSIANIVFHTSITKTSKYYNSELEDKIINGNSKLDWTLLIMIDPLRCITALYWPLSN